MQINLKIPPLLASIALLGSGNTATAGGEGYERYQGQYLDRRGDRIERRLALRERWQGMSADERNAFRQRQRQRWEAMTPEQRDGLRERWRDPGERD